MADWTERIFEFIKKWKYFIQAFWLLSAIGCCFFALDLPNQTVFQFLPPSGSESDIAYNEMGKYFPDFLFIDVEVILVETKWDINKDKTNGILSNPNTSKIVHRINDTIWNEINPNYNLLLTIQSYYDTSNITSTNWSINAGTYTKYGKNITIPINISSTEIQRMIDSASATKYVDPGQDCMLLFVESNINGADTATLNGFIDDIKDSLNNINRDYPEYNLVLTGGITIFQQCMQVIADDITSKDLILLPLIFMIMIYMIGSWKLVALPGGNLGMTIVISFGIFYPFARYKLEVNPMAPSIMMFLSMALSIDYSMFLLSRFASERKQGKSVENAVKEMLRYSAHVVMLSGTILIICYMAIVIFPVSGMETVGYGAAISIFICMFINITMTASAILTFPNYYGTLETFPSCLIRCCAKTCICCPFCIKYRNYNPNTDQLYNSKSDTLLKINKNEQYSISKPADSMAKGSMLGVASNGSIDDGLKHSDIGIADIETAMRENKEQKMKRNCYFKLTQYTTRWPYKLICPLIVYLCMLPGILTLMTMEFSIDFTMNFPKHVQSVDAYNVLINDFNPGDMAPFYILVTSKNNTRHSIYNENYYNALCMIGNELLDKGFENVTQMTSIGFIGNPKYGNLSCLSNQTFIDDFEKVVNNDFNPLTEKIIQNWMNQYPESYEIYNMFMNWFNNTVNQPDQTVSVILAIPNFNPYTASALENCENYRDTIHEIGNRDDIEPYVDIYIHNSLFWEIDSLHETNKTLPWGLAIIITIVFILIGLVFKAIFLPFRLFLCVVVPILFVYGVVTGIYQHGWLNWTKWQSVQNSDGIYWMLPVVTCTVLVGLALDYEIFLYSRVFEYRSKGYTTSASIILGVSSTGPIISAAGCVMAMAFGGLLLENIIASNQMGMVFVFGVLIDTFIVRPMLVPSILSFADSLNWWPTKMPIPFKNEYGQHINININKLNEKSPSINSP